MTKRNAPAMLVDEVDAEGMPAGAFSFFALYGQPNVIAGMTFRCPCGCGDVSGIEFDNVPTKPGDEERWHWNGNREKPTLTPSLDKIDGCRWHGHLTDGEFREC